MSRVGGSAQRKPLRGVSGTLKISLAQYRSLEAFAMFASDLDAATKRQLDRGARLMELLKQGQYDPMPSEKQTVSIWAGSEGHLDDIPVEDVLRFEREFHDYLERKTEILTTIANLNDKLGKDLLGELETAITEFKREFQSSDGGSAIGTEDFDATNEEEVVQEQIVKQR